MQKILTIASECKTVEKATDLDLINLKLNVKPKTRAMKCLTACLMEKVGKVSRMNGIVQIIEQSFSSQHV